MPLFVRASSSEDAALAVMLEGDCVEEELLGMERVKTYSTLQSTSFPSSFST